MGLVALQCVGFARSGIEPVSPALAGGFFTIEPPGKPLFFFFFDNQEISFISWGLYYNTKV